jgi:hypothetical protein
MVTFLLLAVTLTTRVTGFDKHESAFWDAGTKSWYVSNIAGEETGKDGNGWITVLDGKGLVTRVRWIGGLNAPKGIRGSGSTLYVADVDELVVIDIPGRTVKTRIKAPGAQFLNDVAVGPRGEVYVSDTFTNAIYRCTGDTTCEVFVRGENLECPNGLLVDGKRLIVASFGPITDRATFKTKAPGRLLAVDLSTKKVTPLPGKPIGNLDGLEKDGDGFLVSDFMAGKLMRVSKAGEVTVLKDGFKNSADFGYDAEKRTIALPEMSGGVVQLLRIDAEVPAAPTAAPAAKPTTTPTPRPKAKSGT